jgi:hypothetical protein
VGLHAKLDSNIMFANVSVSGFQNGDCVKVEGSSQVMFIGLQAFNCVNLFHSVPISSPATNNSGISVIGGQLVPVGVQTSVLEDGTVGSLPDQNDVYEKIYFGNGTAFIQTCDGCIVRDSTFLGGQVSIGDGSHTVPHGTIVEGNVFQNSGVGTFNDILNTDAIGTVIRDNYDKSSGGTDRFVNNGSGASNTFLEPNTVAAGVTYYLNTGTFAELCQNKLTGTAQCAFSGVGSTGAQTISGCSLSAATGGNMGGSFTAGAGTCVFTVTPGFTAANGFACWSNDTTSAVNGGVTSFTTTSATINQVTTIGHTIVWGCNSF